MFGIFNGFLSFRCFWEKWSQNKDSVYRYCIEISEGGQKVSVTYTVKLILLGRLRVEISNRKVKLLFMSHFIKKTIFKAYILYLYSKLNC